MWFVIVNHKNYVFILSATRLYEVLQSVIFFVGSCIWGDTHMGLQSEMTCSKPSQRYVLKYNRSLSLSVSQSLSICLCLSMSLSVYVSLHLCLSVCLSSSLDLGDHILLDINPGPAHYMTFNIVGLHCQTPTLMSAWWSLVWPGRGQQRRYVTHERRHAEL